MNVIVSTEDGIGHSRCAYHRVFPEIRGEGDTPREAAEKLIASLTSALDGDGDVWQRSYVECAIEDIRAFVAQTP
jgi:hypothetical protein